MIHTIYIHQAEEGEGYFPPPDDDELDFSKIRSIEFEDVDMKDYPDFCDANISYAEIDGRALDEYELYEVNTNGDFVHQKLIESLS
jgi:hypothetical protein